MPGYLLAIIIILIGAVITIAVVRQNSGNPKLPIYIFACVFAVILVLRFSLYSNVRENARQEFKKELNKLDIPNTQLMIDGRLSDLDVKSAIEKFNRVAEYMAHNSYPKTEFEMLLTDGKTEVEFNIGRDSDNYIEYWVTYKDRDIGKIRTSFFQSLK